MFWLGHGLLAAGDGLIQNLSIFSPASPSAQSIVDLAILVFAIIGVIFVLVEGILFYSLYRFRQKKDSPTQEPAQVYGSQPIEVAWTAAPTLVVFFLCLVTARTLWEVKVTPPPPQLNDHALYVTVTGRQWWWEYTYETYDGRKLGFWTANELHIPVSEAGTSRPVYLKLQSADVCHSYWIPRLAGKVDLVPGRSNDLLLQANETGTFLGQCAEYCGTQHAKMLLRVVVESPADFDKWLAAQQQPAVDDPAHAKGKALFLAQSCVNCHRIRGTPAAGTYAPDLTHLMSRMTLASGIRPNDPEQLSQWVHDPQQVKPGCLMPAFGLSKAQEDLIVQYLLSLK